MRAVGFSPDETLLATGGNDRTVRLWDPATGTSLRTLTGHTGSVGAVAFSPDGSRLATAGDDGMLGLWDPATGTSLEALTARAPVNGVAFSPRGGFLATAGSDGFVRLWDPVTGDNPTVFSTGGAAVWRVAFSPIGMHLATGGSDGEVRLWNLATEAEQEPGKLKPRLVDDMTVFGCRPVGPGVVALALVPSERSPWRCRCERLGGRQFPR